MTKGAKRGSWELVGVEVVGVGSGGLGGAGENAGGIGQRGGEAVGAGGAVVGGSGGESAFASLTRAACDMARSVRWARESA